MKKRPTLKFPEKPDKTESNYYLLRANKEFITRESKRLGESASNIVDALITRYREEIEDAK